MQPDGGSRPTPDNEAMWREYMARGDPRERRIRRLLEAIPTALVASPARRGSVASAGC